MNTRTTKIETKTETKTKTETISIRCTKDEKQRLKRYAEQGGYKHLGDYMLDSKIPERKEISRKKKENDKMIASKVEMSQLLNEVQEILPKKTVDEELSNVLYKIIKKGKTIWEI